MTIPIRPIRSYVRREGRMTSSQQNALEHLWPHYGLEIADGLLNYEAVFSNAAPVILEIGFGMGQSLLTMAKAKTEVNFIGVEVHRPGVGALLANLEKENINNVRVYCEDAKEVLKNCIADHSLLAVQVFFPDPWPKKRHHKRRLVQPEFMQLILGKLKSDGYVHLATDWQNYAEYMMEVLTQIEGFYNPYGINQFAKDSVERPLTKYEQRGQRLGHGVWDLVFKKV